MAISRNSRPSDQDKSAPADGSISNPQPDALGAMPPVKPAASAQLPGKSAAAKSTPTKPAERSAASRPAPKGKGKSVAPAGTVSGSDQGFQGSDRQPAQASASQNVARGSQDSGSGPAEAPGERLSDAERQRRIAEAAYRKAQERGFGGDRQLDDWLEAERELNQGHSGTR